MEVQNTKTALLPIIFVGLLSVFYAEVDSGSSPLWFAGWWGLLVVFELYLAHLLFYVNIAIRTNRVSLSRLYLLGCLVGLYEGPITKVLWHGYPGQTASLFFLGFAVTEFIMLVFFWHPIFSFLIPVVFFELLSSKYLESHSMHSWLEDSFFYTRPRLGKFVILAIVFVGAIFLSVNSGFNFGILLISGVVNVFFLVVFKIYLTRNNKLHGIQSLYLSSRWFKIVFLYLVALYAVMFTLIGREYIPGPLTLILTVLIFLFILSLFFLSPVKIKKGNLNYSKVTYNSLIHYSWFLWLALILVSVYIAGIYRALLIFTYLFLLGFGLLVFLTRLVWIFKERRLTKKTLTK